ncbi:MAG: hypothetical protein WC551_14440 [Patescibacteria group bacterium]
MDKQIKANLQLSVGGLEFNIKTPDQPSSNNRDQLVVERDNLLKRLSEINKELKK